MAKRKIKPKKPAPRRELTLKQRAFCTWYVSAECAGNATESARRAQYKGSDTTLTSVGAENLRKPYIRKEIDKLEAEALRNADVTIEKVLKDLETQRLEALASKQYAAAVRCSELQGKYLKMFTDRVEHVQTIEDVETVELVRLLRKIAEAGGIDLIELLGGTADEGGLLSSSGGNRTTH